MIDRILYMWWTGDNPMTENRKRSIEIVKEKCGIELKVLHKNEITDYELASNRFHEAYKYLSATQKGDYLKCYFMHFYGGCYSDIKITNFNWNEYISILETSKEKDVLGYTEEKPLDIGVDPGDPQEKDMRSNFSLFVGNGAYICKKQSVITQQWFSKLNNKLDEKLDQLKKNPAKHHQDHYGAIIDGKRSLYPFRWTEVNGNIFHKVCYENNERVLHGLPRPICVNYR